jgi:hypothetical protein
MNDKQIANKVRSRILQEVILTDLCYGSSPVLLAENVSYRVTEGDINGNVLASGSDACIRDGKLTIPRPDFVTDGPVYVTVHWETDDGRDFSLVAPGAKI